MMGFCGLSCSDCNCYRGTMGSDIPLLDKVAKEWSREDRTWRAQDVACFGCTQEDGRLLFPFCRECSVRLCGLERKVPTCAACPEFDACGKFKDLMKYLASAKVEDKMRLLRSKVLAS